MDLRDQQTPVKGWRRLMRRPSPASLVSVIAHVLLGVMIWNAVQVPAVFDRFLRFDRQAKPAAEKIQFVTVSPPGAAASEPSGVVTRQAVPAARPSSPTAVPLTAPTAIASELPPPAARADSIVPGAVTGPLRGGNGATRGVQPNYDDPRVWVVGDLEFIYAPKTDKERLDSALYATLRAHMDSMAANAYSPNKFERGDWTFGKDGSKWGVDQQYIRLGRFSIPTALLALLPLNRIQGNPIAMERDRNAAYMRNDIMYHAQAAMNEEQFRKAVAAIRDRKEREKRSKVSAHSPGPISSPGEKPPPEY